ncbi:MAG: M15 family metallopeptidase [Bacteroidetes bacterium]|nr:M15 family metallopeptidase [Bacteroidota bacterium]
MKTLKKALRTQTLPAFAFIMLFAVSCSNCSYTNADNKKQSIAETKNIIVKDSASKDSVSKEILLGKIIPSKDTNFTSVDQKYASRKGFYMQKEAYLSFKNMYDAALKEGVKLTIISATRTFNEQKVIWEGKWTGNVLYSGKNLATSYPDSVERSKYVLKYSSMPGTSRHHWGTDVDLNSLSLSYFKTETGKKMYNWLSANASKYGFCQPYTAKDSLRINGYEEEKWHWSYFPVSSKYLKNYKEYIFYEDLKGFAGWETALKIEVIKNYVLSINKECK